MRKSLVILFVACVAVAEAVAQENVLIDGLYYSINAKDRTAGIFYDYDLEQEEPTGTDIPYGSIRVERFVIPATVTYKKRTYRVKWGHPSGLHLIDRSSVRSLVVSENIEGLYESFFEGFAGVDTVFWNADKGNVEDSPLPASATTIIFGGNVRKVPALLCSGMPNLRTVVFPDKLSDIESEAFGWCYRLENLTLPARGVSFVPEAFVGVLNVNDPRVQFVFSNGMVYGWNESGQLIYDRDEHEVADLYGSCVVNGFGAYPFAYADSCKFELLGCSPGAEGDVVIPSSVKYIGPRAFAYCRNITSVSVPDSVQVIEADAFAGIRQIRYSGSLPGAPWGAKSVVTDNPEH